MYTEDSYVNICTADLFLQNGFFFAEAVPQSSTMCSVACPFFCTSTNIPPAGNERSHYVSLMSIEEEKGDKIRPKKWYVRASLCEI